MDDERRNALAQQARALPMKPGVYFMRGAKDELLYIGKARLLRRRVQGYFRRSRMPSLRIDTMTEHVERIDHEVTASEVEALLLEARLVREHQPKYNVMLRDDKSYPYLKLTVHDAWPQLLLTRRVLDDGAEYYGPYTDVKLLRRGLAVMRKLFPLRTCHTLPVHVCLEYHLKQCGGPCEALQTAEAYQIIVDDLRCFLRSERMVLLERLTERMREASDTEQFEEASELRDRVQALSVVTQEARAGAAPVLMQLDVLSELQEVLHLPGLPRRIEAMDISNLFGEEAVGSVVVFEDGRPQRAAYRRFRIKTVHGIDDYAMMHELVSRRYRRLLDEGKALPDLLLVDGGRGHVSSAMGGLQGIAIEGLPVVGLAKRDELVYQTNRKSPLVLPRQSGALKLLQHMRDEAHRFAGAYHRLLRGRRSRESVLDGVPGVGPATKVVLLKTIGSVEQIQQASREELERVPGIGPALAQRLTDYFHT